MTAKTDVLLISNGKDGLVHRCLRALDQHVDGTQLGSVCIAWNGTGEELAEVEKTIQTLKLSRCASLKVLNEPYHYAQNTNILVDRACTSDTLLLLNDDCFIQDDFAKRALGVIQARPDAGTVGCKLVREDKTIQHAGVFCVVDKSGRFVGAGHCLNGKEDRKLADYPVLANTAACMMVSRELFNKLGQMDVGYKKCFEDLQLNLKCVLAGKTNICLGSCVELHLESQTRNPRPCKEDFRKIADFWNANITGFMRASSQSCNLIVKQQS